MVFNEIILGTSPFVFSTHFGHRAWLYELDFKEQPENVQEVLDCAYNMDVNTILVKNSADLINGLDLSIENGANWSVIGMVNGRNYVEDIEFFSKYNTTTIIIDGLFVDQNIDDNMDKIIDILKYIKQKGYTPAIETRTPFKNIPVISESDLMDYFDVIMIPLNFYGYMMDCNFLNDENKDVIRNMVKNLSKKVIANRTLAAGILKPQEAYEFISQIDYIDAVCVGVAKTSEVEETIGIVNSYKS